MEDLVSVIIPNYNYGKYLENCLNAVLCQTYQNIEIIVIDDGSTDNSIEVGRAYGDRIKLIQKENGGVNSARNVGIAAATGKFIAFCDSDDVWHKRKLEKQMKLFENHEELGLVYCGGRVVNEDLIPIRNEISGARGFIAKLFIEKPGVSHITLGSSTAVIRKEFIEKGQFFGENLRLPGEDLEFFGRISNSLEVDFVNDFLVDYRQHSDSRSQVRTADYFEGNRIVFRRLVHASNMNSSSLICRLGWIRLHYSFIKRSLSEGNLPLVIAQIPHLIRGL